MISIDGLAVEFSGTTLFSDISFVINEKDRIALMGKNGAGKSTLLKILAGVRQPTRGKVSAPKDCVVAYLPQHLMTEDGRTVFAETAQAFAHLHEMEARIDALNKELETRTDYESDSYMALIEEVSALSEKFYSIDATNYEEDVEKSLLGLGFTREDFQRQTSDFSGGWRMRIELAKLLLQKPDVLLLDEPTNHLDMQSIAWLENFLINYSGAVIIVAHDRYFLNRVVSKVIEIDHAKATTFLGNYSAYSEKKAQLRDSQLKAWMNQQREIKHQQEVIDKLKSFNREKSIKRAESREKMLEKMEVLDRPDTEVQELKLSLEPRFPSGNDVLRVEGLAKSFGDHTLFTDLDFEIKRGERVALIGNNGTGKTTILKIINELLAADAGSFTLGSKVCIGYYDQEHHVLHMEKTLFEEISDDYPTLTNTEIRNVLAAFLFTGDDVFKRISDLSGGERGRVSLAKLMLSEANFLILDEPTNHLDILSKEILEQALNRYTGTVFYVSHDRYFINQTATRILELTGNTLVNYIGNYDYYLEKKDELTKIYVPSATEEETASLPSSSTETAGKLTWQQQKEEQARIRKRQNELKKTEDRIHVLEVRDKEIDELMMQEEVFTNVAKCVELNKEKTAVNEELEQLYERWEELAE